MAEGWIFGMLCLLAAAALAVWDRMRMGRTFDRIGQMIDAAMDKTFLEKTFDESRMSALETKFAHYLSVSAVSAQNVEREKDKIKTLIGDISHQTKTPIANLLLHSELLREEELTEPAQSSVEAIHEQAEKLRFLIDSLVKLSRLENGIISLNARREALFSMLRSVTDQYVQRAEGKGLYLKLEKTELFAVFDPKWTAEALSNILDNAVKYTACGGITVSAAAFELFVRIDVTDSGAGVSEEEQARIFSRFYRSEAAGEQEGVGIGLYLARQIISGEGGYIRLKSKEGEGSVFSVFLPRG